ncbi:hypothetical protein EJ05DRAFT_513378 [Pseudovirgaria hyperparasitica]|uniref:N-acetylglucosamine-induced protein 1 n=1 Tax=Pseudovirgaria hyperparasitica TaxID=470096 RepID=A0A6A6VZD8_9PEZI|nr:uncharacterized protein EJ05DRAFT_513378 [Pseudovirgaria hyperparasitica]KAF2755060.1 hypothetical protein EJ05DRAFT_513378 [Pseudovirgaria hyperparasitica]
MPHEQPEFWNVNLPRGDWSPSCPPFLESCSDKDRSIIGTPDAEYIRLSWPAVQDIIQSNRVDLFQRVPSDLRKYRSFVYNIVKKYGSMQEFILSKRLQWTSTCPSGPPFANPDDITVLQNDWPYGIDQKIVHLVVWTKFELKDERGGVGDMLPETRRSIDHWVNDTFCTRIEPQHVIWFKNWYSLKSIHAVEHFHVMLYKPDMSFVRQITHGVEPLSLQSSAQLSEL